MVSQMPAQASAEVSAKAAHAPPSTQAPMRDWLALTMGDACGIGPEIIAKYWQENGFAGGKNIRLANRGYRRLRPRQCFATGKLQYRQFSSRIRVIDF